VRYYYALTVTTPAATAQASPQQTAFPMVDGHLRRLEILIPPGHAGLTGIAARNQGVQVVPWGTSGFLVGDDLNLPIDLDYDVATTGLTIFTYNTGQYPHSHYLRAAVDTLTPPGPVGPDLTALHLPPQYVSVI
jgi:hypothetical protein